MKWSHVFWSLKGINIPEDVLVDALAKGKGKGYLREYYSALYHNYRDNDTVEFGEFGVVTFFGENPESMANYITYEAKKRGIMNPDDIINPKEMPTAMILAELRRAVDGNRNLEEVVKGILDSYNV